MTEKDGEHTIVSSVFEENRHLFKASRRLREFQNSYEKHNILTALHNAILLIQFSGAATPDWVLNGAMRVIRERLANPLPLQKGGPSANELAKIKNDLIHFRRWQLVCENLKSGTTKKSKKEVFDEVSKNLKLHGQLVVSPETVEKSYYRVEKDRKDTIQMWKYLPMLPWDELTLTNSSISEE